ncbi:MAG: hypothetical protein MMC33_003575 [Icmadophila ericetorum]|nr:hypothetical protein [Icmadophila ericetorum]
MGVGDVGSYVGSYARKICPGGLPAYDPGLPGLISLSTCYPTTRLPLLSGFEPSCLSPRTANTLLGSSRSLWSSFDSPVSWRLFCWVSMTSSIPNMPIGAWHFVTFKNPTPGPSQFSRDLESRIWNAPNVEVLPKRGCVLSCLLGSKMKGLKIMPVANLHTYVSPIYFDRKTRGLQGRAKFIQVIGPSR